MRSLAALLLLAVLSSPSLAQSWSIKEMNHAIEQTNFVVNGGCSGTLISVRERLILTNYHCIDAQVTSVEREVVNDEGWVKKVKVRKYDDVKVEQHGYDGFTRVKTASYIADIVSENKQRDLAIVRLKGELPNIYSSPLLPDGEKVVRGERIYIVGNPAGEDATLVEGVVSSVNRTFDFSWTNGARLPMIQISGGMYGGNSGGALYNAKGQLIGVPAAGYRDATFIGFAIPVEVVKSFLKDACLASVYADDADDKKCRDDKDAKKKDKSKDE
jgi:S1-C subfamily serine protease